MSKEEYYSRMGKIEGKLRTDRCSFDEIHNLTIQQNYLKTQYIKFLEEENEKLNHYKLLYQKVKERNDKAIDYIEDRYDSEQKKLIHTFDKDNVEELLDILEGNNEI